MSIATQEQVEIIQNILQGFDFSGFYSEEGAWENLKDYLDSTAPNYDFEIRCGASKCVLISDVPPLNNIVIKIPFQGEYFDAPFCWAHNTHNTVEYDDYDDWDYCLVEEELYNYAKEYDVEQFFAGVESIDFYNYPIYVQERVQNTLVELTSLNNPDLFEQSKYISSNLQQLNTVSASFNGEDGWFKLPKAWRWRSVVYCVANNCLEKLSNLISFLRDFNINDLHEGNVGVDFANKPILFDYSGWHD